MGLGVDEFTGRQACSESIQAFLRAVDDLTEYELLGVSRCHGWTRLDVLGHVTGGWQEMLTGVVSVTDDEPSVDAATYWLAFAADYAGNDPVLSILVQRRRTAVYTRPAAARAHLHDVAAALLRGLDGLHQPCEWDGHVFAPGDYLAVWAVEVAVHHLDLLASEPPASSGLRLARATIEALLESPLPRSWSDEEAVLIGTGRLPAPESLGALASRLPVLG